MQEIAADMARMYEAEEFEIIADMAHCLVSTNSTKAAPLNDLAGLSTITLDERC